MDTSNWVDPDVYGWVHHPKSDSDWSAFIDTYVGDPRARKPLARVIEVVRSAGCQTVVVENRYVDPDYRSEYSAFWSRRFQGKPAFARRLHFFKEVIDEGDIGALDESLSYLGYSVVRPVEFGAVGRTVIVPPSDLPADAVLALITDEVSFFGARFTVTGAPFCQQDAEYLRCAHAAAWMCHYLAARRGLVARQVTGSFVEATPAILSVERALPSKGLTLNQLQAVFGSFGQPALFYGLALMPRVRGVADPQPQVDADGMPLAPGLWDTRIFSVICRYLNSRYPVLIGTTEHAFVVAGWFRDADKIRFVVNDDQQGPYRVVDSPFTDSRAPWRSIMVPLPPKVFLSGEAAETEAHRTLSIWAAVGAAPQPWKDVGASLATKKVSLRTVLRDGSDYKAALQTRGIPPDAARVLRLARLPHFVWVVECQDRGLRDAGKPSVVAEVVLDATSHDLRPARMAMMLPGAAVVYPPDDGRPVVQPMPIGASASELPLPID